MLSPKLMLASKYFLKFAGKHFHSDTKCFDWTTFKSAVSSYPGHDLTAGKFISTTITQDDLNTQTMFSNVVSVSKLFWAGIDTSALKGQLEAVVIGPGQKPESHIYQCIFASNSVTANRFYSLVVTIKLQVDKPSRKISAVFSAMVLELEESFRAPR